MGSVDQINKLLFKIGQRKSQLLEEIREEYNYLKANNIEVDIDINNFESAQGFTEYNKRKYLELRNKLVDLNYIDNLKSSIETLPRSNGTSFFKKIDVNIGIIADEFLYNSFKDVANFYYVNRENYEKLQGKIEVLVIASTWKGIEGDWKGLGNPNVSKIRKSISKVINFFKKDGVKIVFYSKEDPTNYDYFVDIAQKCDYIFTTAEEKVDDYKKDCNNENVFVLEFGVNPLYNNPIGIKSSSQLDGAIFAGSWYKKYPHRQKDTRVLFDGVIQSGKPLKIIDRNFHLNLERHFYPPVYLEYISPSIDHQTLQGLFKLYGWVINLNSVKYSSTMFANRVFELQAMGNAILSNFSLGINNLFPNIFFAFNASEIKAMINTLNEKELYQLRMHGVRKVLREHTTFHRISYLLNKIGYEHEFITPRKIVVIVKEKSHHVQDMFDQQTYPYKKLLQASEVSNVKEKFDFITFFDETSFYGEYYLQDMLNAFKYTDVNFVTKGSYYHNGIKVEGVENNFIDKFESKYRTVFSLDNNSLEDICENIESLNFENGYSCDSLEYDTGNVPKFNTQTSKKFTVIIPTFNNGEHLYGKCFMSLRRSSKFNEMEILIVDDGSTDKETLTVINRLDRMYDNVRTFKFNDNGSGSASRPRNKGIQLATTKYITFLDPDNEGINDGFTKLYNEIEKGEVDLVIGNMKKVDIKERDFNYYKDVQHYEGKTVFAGFNPKNFLENTHFKAQSIQALMVKKSIIDNYNLKMVDGVVGQDTLFFHEIINSVSTFKVIDELIHIYYAGIQGSAVNGITSKTFEKYLRLEEARVEFLERNDLIEPYIRKRFNYYFKNWYLNKLEKVEKDQKEEALVSLLKIYELYEKFLNRKLIDPDLKSFIKQLKKI
ncbi:glycosyltransferase [Virgibacillus pantothenticus]|uniref:glycosyltransferase n=1 Tax=Virgibacillus pantothenticus TaxID=1473 RepID=UPI001C226319|nr:glycosyltransferase [Virgibacillus pantothenticus]MBU8566612.1 glycosyltransferase [Virgibacillus pantothenticus]MBU8599104.1 glycosyltransferase [Virgibacillus pantothenticus]MBU8634769.1 glycosyltransferase [Virgibacillus pantothenticus]MBU8641148.1 glycosyltransferase [Virgibacillus pantothenticus]MBU8645226.1 glycosyltransferase [Virgibacillus pantothenticus]